MNNDKALGLDGNFFFFYIGKLPNSMTEAFIIVIKKNYEEPLAVETNMYFEYRCEINSGLKLLITPISWVLCRTHRLHVTGEFMFFYVCNMEIYHWMEFSTVK